MLDIEFITQNPDIVRRAIEQKNSRLDLDELLATHADMKARLQQVEILKDGVNLAIYADRFRLAPAGLLGGTEATRARCEIERGGKIISLPSKGRVDLFAGDILTLYTAGGGGYGPPAEREPALIAKDVAEGIITEATAMSFYGRTG